MARRSRRVHPPRPVHCCKPRQDKECHHRWPFMEPIMCKLLEVHHHTLPGHRISSQLITPITTRIHVRALKAPATGSWTGYVFLVGTTTRVVTASMSARFLSGFDSLSSSSLANCSIDHYTPVFQRFVMLYVLICLASANSIDDYTTVLSHCTSTVVPPDSGLGFSL